MHEVVRKSLLHLSGGLPVNINLCIPGGKPISTIYEKVSGFRFDGVRIDIPDNHIAATDVLRELVTRPYIDPILLLAGGKMTRQHPKMGGPAWRAGELVAHVNDTCIKMQALGLFDRPIPPAIEIGNEPDLAVDEWKKKPELLAETFSRCYDVVRKYSQRVRVLSPSVSNLNNRGFEYLEAMIHSNFGLPLGCHIAVHRYPNGPNFEIPHDGFRNRGVEVTKLLQLAGRRPVWITEVGMREGPHGRGEDPLYLTEEEVAGSFEWEMYFWSRVPQVQGVCWYGINDGPDRRNELDTYGVRRLDGSWKPVAHRVAAVKAVA